jgi:CRISPR-associated protein Cas2
MIVVTLSDSPYSLRGDLSKWLQEISTGVYVGNVNPRVREEIWKRICSNIKDGKAIMAFSADNEQRMNFYVHNTGWEPIDFDGLKLIMRPSSARLQLKEELKSGFSKIAKMRKVKQVTSGKTRKNKALEKYVVIDIETTGLSELENEIIEIGAILICGKQIKQEFHSLVKCRAKIPPKIQNLTGISDEMLLNEGNDLSIVIKNFLEFVGNYSIISHNAVFDYGFIRMACKRLDLPLFSNPSTDTLSLARRKIVDIDNYKLGTLTEHFGIKVSNPHRSISDCIATYQIYEKLNEIE